MKRGSPNTTVSALLVCIAVGALLIITSWLTATDFITDSGLSSAFNVITSSKAAAVSQSAMILNSQDGFETSDLAVPYSTLGNHDNSKGQATPETMQASNNTLEGNFASDGSIRPIPKLIHQSLEDRSQLPCVATKNIKAWIELNPGYR